MAKHEKNTSLYTHLAVLIQVPLDRKRGSSGRERFHCYLPFVGQVCRPVFARCYGVVPMTLQRYKKRIRDGNMTVKDRGNKLNKNAAQVDVVWLVKWFTTFAEEVGEVVPVRSYDAEGSYATLPYDLDSLSAQQRRDICAIYHAGMCGGITTDKSEALGRHTESARQMRREYKGDKSSCSSEHAVIVKDYYQNLTIPSVANTPSQWYFCSLLSVSCFGIYYENDGGQNDGSQTNYIYDEGTSGKGSDRINSMLAHFINANLVPSGKTKLTVYADNCSCQNKNNYAIKFLLTLVDLGIFEHVEFKFFTMSPVIDAVNATASNSVTVHVPRGSDLFKSYKPVLTELYKRLDGVQQYQIFSMDSAKPGEGGANYDRPHRSPTSAASNAEKKEHMYKSNRPGSYCKVGEATRLAHRAAMAAAAKKNQDGRGMADDSSDAEPLGKKKKQAQKKRGAPNKKPAAKTKKRKYPTSDSTDA
ncbi:hypothetical protein ON010_g18263 [Phytophthora cinnamomi]|nr:hypothetical protein ON010_g18263 [Phytophthora cinnamomi]